MAEDRMIRAEMRTSATVNSWPRDVRYFWTQLWGYCDDYGRGLYELRVIRALTFPMDDDVTVEMISDWMGVLEEAQVIRQYVAQGRLYFECINWDEHQKLKYKKKSKLPAPSGFSESSETFEKSAPEVEVDIEEEREREGEGVKTPPSPFCSAHMPFGPNGEACKRCADAKTAYAFYEKTKPTPTPGRRPRKGDGHPCVDDGNGWCSKCQEKVA